MMLQMRSPLAARPVQRVARRAPLVCRAQAEESSPIKKAVALPLASMVAAALIAGAAMPEDALAASSRSGGRIGGSSGFQARKAPPSRNIQTQAAPTVNNTTVVVASPPMFSPFGFSPFGGFGMGFGMPVMIGGGFFSSIISLMFVTLLFSVVFNVVKGFISSSNKGKGKDDSWGDL